MDICDWMERQLENSPDKGSLKSILASRRKALRRGMIVGLCVTVPIAAIAVIAAIQSNAHVGAFSIFALYFLYRVIASRFEVQPHVVLLLRRFRTLSKKDMSIAKIIGEGCRGLGVAITVQDSSFRGDLPLGFQAFQRYILMPGAPLLAVLLIFLLVPREELSAFPFAVAFCVVTGVLYLAGWLVLRRLAVYRASSSAWESTIDMLVRKIRSASGRFSGTAVVKLPDDVWQLAVLRVLENADAAVIDLTDLSDNVKWEIQQTYGHLPPEKILLTWANDSGKDEAVPATYKTMLVGAVGESAISRSKYSSYPTRKESPATMGAAIGFEGTLPLFIARCLAADKVAPETVALTA